MLIEKVNHHKSPNQNLIRSPKPSSNYKGHIKHEKTTLERIQEATGEDSVTNRQSEIITFCDVEMKEEITANAMED